jgi:hypothetical protein
LGVELPRQATGSWPFVEGDLIEFDLVELAD